MDIYQEDHLGVSQLCWQDPISFPPNPPKATLLIKKKIQSSKMFYDYLYMLCLYDYISIRIIMRKAQILLINIVTPTYTHARSRKNT